MAVFFILPYFCLLLVYIKEFSTFTYTNRFFQKKFECNDEFEND